MEKMNLSPRIQKNLETQGFKCDIAGFDQIEPWLRFNPTICFLIALSGLILGSPTVFFILAGVAFIGALFPHGAGDLIYNHGLRQFLGTPPLAPNPAPRRFACLVGTVWSLAIGWAFLTGYTVLAYILGIILLLVIIPMITVHFCIASVIYQKVFGYSPG